MLLLKKMMKPPIPMNESERLKALQRYHILDTAAEASFDDITRIAAQICGTPTAMISFIDSNRQWVKSRVGVPIQNVPRDISLCAHAILGNGLLAVEDTRLDERFADNPLVTGETKYVFYAAAALRTPEGLNIGTLCVIAHDAGRLTDTQMESLQALARQVVHLLEMRLHSATALNADARAKQVMALTERAAEDLRQAQTTNEQILQNSQDWIQILDREGKILSVSPGARKALGRNDLASLLRTSWLELWSDLEREKARRALQRALDGEKGHFVGFHPTEAGQSKWWDVTVTPIEGMDGQTERVLTVARDVTLSKIFEEERERSARLLDAERAKMQAYLKRAPVGICVVRGPEWRFEVANEEFHRFAGVRETLVGQKFDDVFGDHRFDEWSSFLHRVIQDGKSLKLPNYRVSLRGRDGEQATTTTEFDLQLQPLFGPEGDVEGVLTITLDTTEKNEALKALRLWEGQFRQATEAVVSSEAPTVAPGAKNHSV